MNTCIATIPSLNTCIKAQKALSSYGYYCKVVSVDPRLTRRGCAYGIQFSCDDERSVRQILSRAGIRISQIVKNTEGTPI